MSGEDVTRGRVTISEAATLLGVHPNTVRKRVKAGVYDAEKIVTSSGPTWLITRESLSNTSATTPVTHGSQSLTGRVQGQDLERVLTELVRAIEKDPRKENYIEQHKLMVRVGQTQAAVGSGLLVTLSAVVSLMDAPQALSLLYVSFGLLIGSVSLSFGHLFFLGLNVGLYEGPRRSLRITWAAISGILAWLQLVAGLIVFMGFLASNPV